MTESRSSSSQSQSVIRAAAKRKRARLTSNKRRAASNKIAEKLFATELFRNSNNIACYVSLETEVSTWRIIERAWQQKKRIFAPIAEKNFILQFLQFDDESELVTSNIGLREPKHGRQVRNDELDLVIVPLVAFDSQRNRIGMGGGYYDRAFSFLAGNTENAKPALIGLGFDCQQVDKIRPNPWDIRLFRIFTETAEF
jgi:5-formyltetrahydrofolate cyclo-ligase